MEKVRGGAINSEQKRILIECMEMNPNLRSGKFSNEFSFKTAQNLCMEISTKLNAIPGAAVKDWRQWHKVSDNLINYLVYC